MELHLAHSPKHLRTVATLEDAIGDCFLPALTGRMSFNYKERELLALPARLKGLGIIDPTKCSQRQFNASSRLSEPLASLIQQKNSCYPEAIQAEQK